MLSEIVLKMCKKLTGIIKQTLSKCVRDFTKIIK